MERGPLPYLDTNPKSNLSSYFTCSTLSSQTLATPCAGSWRASPCLQIAHSLTQEAMLASTLVFKSAGEVPLFQVGQCRPREEVHFWQESTQGLCTASVPSLQHLPVLSDFVISCLFLLAL